MRTSNIDSTLWHHHAWLNRLQSLLLLAFMGTFRALLGLSRTREYDADLNAARLTGDPEGLARAFMEIDRLQGHWLERLFLPGRRIPEPSLLRTHPPTTERVRSTAGLAAPPRFFRAW